MSTRKTTYLLWKVTGPKVVDHFSKKKSTKNFGIPFSCESEMVGTKLDPIMNIQLDVMISLSAGNRRYQPTILPSGCQTKNGLKSNLR
jgi:hypothetical protein